MSDPDNPHRVYTADELIAMGPASHRDPVMTEFETWLPRAIATIYTDGPTANLFRIDEDAPNNPHAERHAAIIVSKLRSIQESYRDTGLD